MSKYIKSEQYTSRLVVCEYCQGSGLFIEFSHSAPDIEQTECPKCKGEGRLLRIENIVIRPITMADKVKFRKVINS